MRKIFAISMVFLGCCTNVVFLELIVSELPGSGNIITFCQFVFIALEGFVTTAQFGTKKPVIPLKNYFVMVAMFFVVQVINNQALFYNISMPLHMIFRSGSLIANMILGIIILKKRYNLDKYMSVFMITVGICISTFASAGQVESHPSHTGNQMLDYINWLIGIAMLCFALFMSARMGIFQEQMFSKHGKHPNEAMFYNHALPLPGFLLVARDIYNHAILFQASAPIIVPLLGISVPKMWLYLLGNVITQYICIRAVFVLTTECASLTVTMVVTLRKFVSLIFSIIYFMNPFTLYHWIGTALVFGGTFLFADVIPFGKKEKKLQ
ncbi:hypothetical protein ACJMK2_016562 [Sinanodonta woodiana]|uniref:UDP-xylose and UDP-N-acetylglucosamine transporter n=1 Tax=Sinanodonta woodiana TaxID=1069815 RepID=A0ABD3UUU1_SINWO